MQVDIQARGFALTADLRQHAQRRLLLALSWSGDDVGAVSMHLSPSQGPRGGKDKRCCILVHFPGAADEVIEDTELDIYDAVDRAIDRTARRLAHRLKRLQHDRLAGEAAGDQHLDADAVLAPNTP